MIERDQLIEPLSYRPDIDGMRAVAVLLVLIFHFSLLPAVTGGFLGVDVFFVISGFLITTIITQQLNAGNFTLRAFYMNRVRRLAPALFVVLFGVMGAGALWLLPNDLAELSRQSLAAQFYFANFYFWRNVNYFGLNVHDVPLLHTWSLAAEEQFYLCFPALLMLLHRRLRQYSSMALIIALSVSFLLNIYFVGPKPEATFYLFPTRAWELLMGALVPVLSVKWARDPFIDELLGALGLGLLVAAVTGYHVNYPIPGLYALLPTLATVCLIMSAQRRATAVANFLGIAPIVYIGKISYSLYLVHWPINFFASLLIPEYSLAWRWVMFAVSIILAISIYHVVETPVRLRKLLPTNGKLLRVYLAGLFVTLASIGTIIITNGLPGRFSPEVVRLASYVNDKAEPLTECEFLSPPVIALEACHMGVAGREPSWLIYGDSHAWAAHAAFDHWLKQINKAGMLVFRHACPPLTGIHFPDSRDGCFKFNQAVTQFIEERSSFRHIVLVSTWKWPVDGGLVNASHTLLTPRESTELFTERFVHTIEHLSNLQREVYVWEPVPGARKSVPLELARAAWHHRATSLQFDLDEYLYDNRLFFDALATSRQWITASFSPSKILCATGKCAVEKDGNPLYFDTAHIANSSVDFWVEVLLRGEVKP